MNITSPVQFLEIIKRGYSLDGVYLLELINENVDIQPLCKENVKIYTLHQTLIRKGLIFETEDKLTTLGKDILTFILTPASSDVKLEKKKPDGTDFDNWWKAYPGTNSFTYKGRTFTGDRALRVKKEDCRTKYNKIILEGEYTPAQLLSALEIEITQKKEKSIKEGTNKMSYMQNSLTYLNQRTFEPFIELINEPTSFTENTGRTIDL